MEINFGDGGTEEDMLLRMKDWCLEFTLNDGQTFDGVIEAVNAGKIAYWPWSEDAGEAIRTDEPRFFYLDALKSIFVY